LWKAHNEANKRLSGDETEDPEHVKIQFPSRNTCPSCRNKDDSWNIDEVMNHLKQMYGKQNISYVGVENENIPSDVESVFVEQFVLNGGEKKRFGWNFNIFDISLCVILYAFSATILILVCIKFVMRRGYRKKLYVRDILGKV
jgi:thiol oxidase